jgi:UbiD family decarboxylase
MSAPVRDLRAFLDLLRARGELVEIRAEVDPRLEAPEIHRRVVARGGPALLFLAPKGSRFRLAMNLFGTPERTMLAFGERPRRFIERLVEGAHSLLPPTMGKLWGMRGLAREALRIGLKGVRRAPVLEVEEEPALDRLPATTSWSTDGGPFLTLPLVYTQHPETGRHNLGIYRMHVHGPSETGMHFQIHKGGGFHHHAAERRGQPLPATVFLGGPPALMLAAIAPLPEDVPELLLASLLLGERLPVVRGRGPHPIVANAEFALCGHVLAGERRLEGPFGDHYGYDSRAEAYPVFRADRVLRRGDAIFPATVVGPPRQEDFYVGDYLQELLAPLFPLVMPSVRALWAYGETGFHSLAAAVVRERYAREALVSGLRILGEGQLSLTKCLILLDDGTFDPKTSLRDFRAVWTHWLERCDFSTDVVVLGRTAMDSLDYTGPMVHRGSKALFVGVGEPRRTLPTRFAGALPSGVFAAAPFVPGCLVLSTKSYAEDPDAPSRIARDGAFDEWPLLVLVDDLAEATASVQSFLWTVFTRFEPAGDIHARRMHTERFHTALETPVVFDARLQPRYPAVMEVDAATRDLVDRRWPEYGLPA